MVWGSNPTDDHYFSLVLKFQCLMRPYYMQLETGSRLVASAILCAQRFLGVRGKRYCGNNVMGSRAHHCIRQVSLALDPA